MTHTFHFSLLKTEGLARLGELHTLHGTIKTPAFMPVGTAGSVKALYLEQVQDAGSDIILANTYHMMLRPGAERVARLGGLHRFMGWEGPILTDSGGYQVMSLSKLSKITEEGVTFSSHIDGRSFFLSPERAMEIQALLGSTIQMQLDECLPFPHSEAEALRAMLLSLRWAERSKKAFGTQEGRGCFGIVQGGVTPRLRQRSAQTLVDLGFEGYGIGGLAVGEGQALMLQTLEHTLPFLPHEKPRYLMGVGTPSDLLEAVARGVDMFDCVLPTRVGRHGHIFTRLGKMNIKNAQYAEDGSPLDETHPHPVFQKYSKAYVHHLFKAREILGMMIASWANIVFYQTLMSDIRDALGAGQFEAFKANHLYQGTSAPCSVPVKSISI